MHNPRISVFTMTMYLDVPTFQLANHLDRAAASIGRKALKVLVQVNTSGEECEYSLCTKLD